MDIQAEKIELTKLLLDVKDPDIINQVKAILQHTGPDFYNSLPNFIKNSIEAGIKDVESGNIKSHDEVIQSFRSKYVAKH